MSLHLPCEYFYRLFKKHYLFRHIKKCKSNESDTKNSKTVRVQADAQNLLLSFKETDDQLIKEVFPRMAPDKISRIAKTDTLIKLFGSRYLKCHKKKKNIL